MTHDNATDNHTPEMTHLVRTWPTIIGVLPPNVAARVAEELTVNGNTLAHADVHLHGARPPVAWPQPATAADVQAWSDGTQPIPAWVTRALLQLHLEHALDDEEDE